VDWNEIKHIFGIHYGREYSEDIETTGGYLIRLTWHECDLCSRSKLKNIQFIGQVFR